GQAFGQRLRCLLGDIDEADLRSLGREMLDDAGTDARSAAGNEDCPVLERGVGRVLAYRHDFLRHQARDSLKSPGARGFPSCARSMTINDFVHCIQSCVWYCPQAFRTSSRGEATWPRKRPGRAFILPSPPSSPQTTSSTSPRWSAA